MKIPKVLDKIVAYKQYLLGRLNAEAALPSLWWAQ